MGEATWEYIKFLNPKTGSYQEDLPEVFVGQQTGIEARLKSLDSEPADYWLALACTTPDGQDLTYESSHHYLKYGQAGTFRWTLRCHVAGDYWANIMYYSDTPPRWGGGQQVIIATATEAPPEKKFKFPLWLPWEGPPLPRDMVPPWPWWEEK